MIMIIECSSMIYDQYIINDDNQIKELVRSMVPIYSRHLRHNKLKYYYRWKLINTKISRYYSSLKEKKKKPEQKSRQKRRLFKDNNKWDFNNTYCTLIDTKATQDVSKCTFSPKINTYVPIRVPQSNSKIYKTIEETRDEKRNKRCHRSMKDIFQKVDLPECCKVTFPEYTTTTRPFYSYREIIRSSDNINYKAKTIEINPSTKNTTQRERSKLTYTPNYFSNAITPFPSKRSITDIKHLNNTRVNKDEANKKLVNEKSKDNFRNLIISSCQLSLASSNKINKNKHYNNNSNVPFRHISLQSLSDSKLLQLATHYITTDESLEKFKLNLLK